MDIKIDFSMLCYTVDLCTTEGYRFVSGDCDGITIGTYEPTWLRIRTTIIDYYQRRNPDWGS